MYLPDHMNDYDLEGDGFVMWNPNHDTRHPPEVLELLDNEGLALGGSTRILHKFKRDGSICSQNKDACLQVSRSVGHVFYFCHRCGETGRVYNTEMSPRAVSQQLDAIVDNLNKELDEKVNSTILKKRPQDNLPSDMVFLSSVYVPAEAKNYLNQFGLTQFTCDKYKIGWSESWKRLVFPLYFYIRTPDGRVADQRLMGWSGRCVSNLSKKERQDLRRPKWVSKKCDGEVERLHFMAPRTFNYSVGSPVVFVEDPISAMKVNQAYACDVIALLNHSVPYSLVSNYRHGPVLFWLDPDVRSKSLKEVSRYKSLGFSTAEVQSQLDPKYYSQQEIHTKLDLAIARTRGGDGNK